MNEYRINNMYNLKNRLWWKEVSKEGGKSSFPFILATFGLQFYLHIPGSKPPKLKWGLPLSRHI